MSKIDPTQRQEFVRFLLELCEQAGEVVVPYFRQPIDIENKASQENYDPVTIADREAERHIRQSIANRFPEHSVRGEEMSDQIKNSPFTWVIDPIDGTRAFVCGIPTWATLIGLCFEGTPVLGAMSQPIVGDCFIGGLGQAELIRTSGSSELKTNQRASLTESALFATSPDMFETAAERKAFSALAGKVRMTRFGVDSYAYCLLAAGHIELVVESGLGFYDIAALIPLVESAGGVITDWGGKPLRAGGQVIAAANRELHLAALEILRAAD